MKKIKVMSIFGTRPEAIKMCPLVKELESRNEIESIVCVTAQHREMLDSVLKTFDVNPNYDLNIMEEKQDLFDITSNILKKMKQVLVKENPDLVLVHGDTSTTFSAALASFYLKIPIGHVEAGLRTYNLYSPFPEEFNRQAVSRLATYHFAPTQLAANNLLKEGIDKDKIFITGNTAIDALKTTVQEGYHHPLLDWVGDDKLILITAHRRENLGQPMKNMFQAIRGIVDSNSNIKVVYPIHMNPTVRNIADSVLEGQERIRLVEPLDVVDFHNFMSKSYMILTDSGGIQEEAPSLGKPVLVMRETTERPEGVEAGTLILVGTEEEKIYNEFNRLIEDRNYYNSISKAKNPYGDGQASKKIADTILRHL